MSEDSLQLLLERLRAQEGISIPTTSLGRLRRTASAGARMGLGALAGRLRGGDFSLGSLSPDVLAGLVESLGELKGVAMKAGQILSYVDGSLEPEARFLEECDYSLEARRQTRFVEIYAEHASIAIPRVFLDCCGPRVLTTAWHDGAGLEAFLGVRAPIEARERAARALYEFYVGTLYRYGIFNADPHPGNFLFATDGHTTILDHGCVREFEHRDVVALIRLSRAVRRDDARGMQEALGDIGMPKPTADFDVTRRLLRGFYAPLLVPGRHAIKPDRAVAVAETVKLKRSLMRMRLPGKLLFLFRIRFGLSAVLSRLGAELDWAALEDELTVGGGRR